MKVDRSGTTGRPQNGKAEGLIRDSEAVGNKSQQVEGKEREGVREKEIFLDYDRKRLG